MRKSAFRRDNACSACRDLEWLSVHATSLKHEMLGRSYRQTRVVAMIYRVVSSRVGGSLRIARSVASGLACSTLAWLTMRLSSPARRIARRSSVIVGRYFIARPRLMQRAKPLLRRFPAIEGRLRMMLSSPEGPRRASIPSSLSDLSPHARSVYAELKAAIAKVETSR